MLQLRRLEDGAEADGRAALGPESEHDIVLGRGMLGLPQHPKIHRRHARVGFRDGVPQVSSLGKQMLGIERVDSAASPAKCVRIKVSKGEYVPLLDGDILFFLSHEQGLHFRVSVAAGEAPAEAAEDLAEPEPEPVS